MMIVVRRHIAVLIFGVISGALSGQPAEHTFSEIDSLQQVAPKPVVVFLHTDWCTICHAMQATTFADERVVQMLDESFYFVSFNAESEKPIYFHGHTYRFRPTGLNTGAHELAEQLGKVDGKMAFPTTCILRPRYEVVFRHNSYLGADGMVEVLEEIENY